MPRIDRTFSSADILRFIDRNLDATEVQEVINALTGGTSTEEERLRQQILNVLGQLFPPINFALGVAREIQSTLGTHPLVELNIETLNGLINQVQQAENQFPPGE